MSEVLTSFRHELHAHPELAHAEHATADRVVAFMQQFNPTEMVTGIAGTGVVVTFDSGVEGPRMLFRCELDALPVVEIGVDGYTSVDAGVSHKCGHDGQGKTSASLPRGSRAASCYSAPGKTIFRFTTPPTTSQMNSLQPESSYSSKLFVMPKIISRRPCVSICHS